MEPAALENVFTCGLRAVEMKPGTTVEVVIDGSGLLSSTCSG